MEPIHRAKEPRLAAPRLLLAVSTVTFCLVSFALFGGPAPLLAFVSPASLPDPVPLRRVLVQPEQMPALLEQARQGVLLELPRAQFEQQVQRAAQTLQSARNPPRLVEARYQAALEEGGLVGTARWTILHTAGTPGILPLQPFTLALQKVELDHREAILGELDGKNPGVWMESSGTHALTLDWTAHGEEGPNGVRFELRVPACALASLDLVLPADRVPTLARDGCLLSGPVPAQAAGRRLWRLDCAGVSQIDLLIQRDSGPGQRSALVLARQQTRQRLSLDDVEADFDFTIEVLHGKVREFTFACDPHLRPLSVSIRNADVETWELRSGSESATPATLIVRLAEPFEGTGLPVRVRCLAPAHPGIRWTCPGLVLLDAISLGETVSLAISKDVQLDSWQAGDFVLTRTSTDPAGNQTITLQSGLRKTAPADSRSVPAPERPSATIHLHQADIRARSVAWWHIQPEGSSLSVHAGYEVVRGRLFRLGLHLPPQWTPEKVDVSPTGLAGNWIVVREDGRDTLIIDLDRPVEAPGRVMLKVKLLPAEAGSAPSQRAVESGRIFFPLPEIAPEGATLWDGGLGVTVDPLFQATVVASTPPASPAYRVTEEESRPAGRKEQREPGTQGQGLTSAVQPPWGNEPPQFYYPAHGQPISGTLHLGTHPPRVEARCTTEVAFAGDHAVVSTRLEVRPQPGGPKTLDLVVSTLPSQRWAWRVVGNKNSVRSMVRLRAGEIASAFFGFAAGSPLEAIGSLALPLVRGSLWRLTLAEPLAEPLTLETTQEIVDQEPGGEARNCRWEIPLVHVLGAERMEGEVKLQRTSADVMQIDTVGLQEGPIDSATGTDLDWRSYQYGQAPVSLVLRGRPASMDVSSYPETATAHLTAFVTSDGRLLHRFAFQIHHWKQRTLPVRLPRDAEYLASKLDGHWITQATVSAIDDALVLDVPVASAATVHRFEILYALKASPWQLWTRVRSQNPELPLKTTAFRRSWCLADGLAPVHEEHLQRLSGPEPSGRLQAIQAVIIGPLHQVLPLPVLRQDHWRPRQERLLAEAAGYLQNQHSQLQDQCLGDVVTYLVMGVFKGRAQVVIDQQGLQEAGIGRFTRLSGRRGDEQGAGDSDGLVLDPLARLGLVLAPTPDALLLTTRRQWQAWQSAGRTAGSLPEPLQTALMREATTGYDESGRFQTALDWLGQEDGGLRSDDESFPCEPATAGWTEWQPVSGSLSEETLLVIRQDRFIGVTLGVTGLLLLVGWRARLWPARRRYGSLVIWLGLGAVATVWLPSALAPLVWWPLLATAVLAVVGYVGAAAGRITILPVPGAKQVAAVLLMFIVVLGMPGNAVEPAPPTVWLLSAKAGEKPSVLAPPELLEQLRNLERRGAGASPGAVLVAARYEGSSRLGVADFIAEFRAYCFRDEETDLVVPLGGIELQDALVDGERAFPRALPPPQTGYSFKVKGKGAHAARLRFRVTTPGGGQEVRFTIPELARSQLLITVPAGAQYLHAGFARGKQSVRAESAGMHLEADLGRMNTVHVRWQEKDPKETPPVVQVRELYFWDLKLPASRLLGILQYSTSGGAVTTLEIAVPENMEVRRVESGPLPAGAGTAPLKGWRLEGAGPRRRLHVDFQFPVAQGVQLFLELIARAPLEPGATLALPTPLGTVPAPSLDNYLGYRLAGCDGELVEHRGVTGIEPLVFVGRWQPAGTEDPGTPQRAYTFRRGTGGGPALRLSLKMPRPRLQTVQDILWRVGPRQAELHARAQVKSTEAGFGVVEWKVPSEIVVADILGKEILSWSRSGSRVQAWLQQTVNETTLELVGRMPRGLDEPASARFDIPCLSMVETATSLTYVRVIADKGLAMKPVRLANLWSLPDLGPSPEECSYLTQQANYAGTLQIQKTTVQPSARILTLVEVVQHRLRFTSDIRVRTNAADSVRLTLRLRNWKGQDVKLNASQVTRRAEHRDPTGAITWVLDLLADEANQQSLKLTGELPVPAGGAFLMPDVVVDEIPSAEQNLAVLGRDYVVQEVAGAKSIGTAEAARSCPVLKDYLHGADALVWKVQARDWKLQLRPRVPGTQSLVRIFLAEQSAASANGRHWVHWMDYWLYHGEGSSRKSFVLPEDAEFLKATIDEREVMPVRPTKNRLWVPLPSGSGTCKVRLYWTYSDYEESFERPNLAGPVVEGSAADRVTEPSGSAWSIRLPTGYRILQHRGSILPESAAEKDLRRAVAQLRLTGFLAEQASQEPTGEWEQQLRKSQECFYRNCRHAEVRLAQGPANQADLTARLDGLLVQNTQLAQAQHFERIRAQAENHANTLLERGEKAQAEPDDPGPAYGVDGTLSYWQTETRGEVPQVELVAVEVQQKQRAWGLTGLCLLLFLLAWILPYFPRLVSWVFGFWPEELLLLGILGWFLLTPCLAFALLGLLGFLGRITYAIRWLSTLSHTRAASGAPSGAG